MAAPLLVPLLGIVLVMVGLPERRAVSVLLIDPFIRRDPEGDTLRLLDAVPLLELELVVLRLRDSDPLAFIEREELTVMLLLAEELAARVPRMVSDPVLDIRGVELVDNEVVDVLLTAYVML